MSDAFVQAVLAYSPKGFYLLNDAVGILIAKDSSGNGYDGAVNGGFAFGQPSLLKGSGLHSALDDGSSGYITLPAAMKPDGWSLFTVLAWFQLTSQSFGANARIASNGHTDSDSKGFQCMIPSNGASGQDGFTLGTTAGQDGVKFAQTVIAGTPHMYAATYDGSIIKLFLDASFQNSHAHTGTIIAGDTVINIGRGVPYNGDFFPGALGPMAFINAALNQAQLSTLNQLGLASNICGVRRRRWRHG